MADSSIWPNVVTAVATVSGSLGVTVLTLRYNARRAVLEQQDRLRADQRQAVVDLLHIGHEWVTAATALATYAAVTSPQQIPTSDWGQSYGETQAEFRRRLVTARVVVTEPDVAATVRALSGVYERMPKMFGRFQVEKRRENGLVSPDVMAEAWVLIDLAKDQVADIERAALERFSQPPTTTLRRWLKPWRWLQAKRAEAPALPEQAAGPAPAEPVQSSVNGGRPV